MKDPRASPCCPTCKGFGYFFRIYGSQRSDIPEQCYCVRVWNRFIKAEPMIDTLMKKERSMTQILDVWSRFAESGPTTQGWCKKYGIGGECMELVSETSPLRNHKAVKFWDDIYQSLVISKQRAHLDLAGLLVSTTFSARDPRQPPEYNKHWVDHVQPTLDSWQHACQSFLGTGYKGPVTLHNEESDEPYRDATIAACVPIFENAGIPTISATDMTTYKGHHTQIDRSWSLAQTEDHVGSLLSKPNYIIDEYWLAGNETVWRELGAAKWMVPIRMSFEMGKPYIFPFVIGEREQKWGNQLYSTNAIDLEGNLTPAGEMLQDFLDGQVEPEPEFPPCDKQLDRAINLARRARENNLEKIRMEDVHDGSTWNRIGRAKTRCLEIEDLQCSPEVIQQVQTNQDFEAFKRFLLMRAVAIRSEVDGLWSDYRISGQSFHDGPFPGVVEAVDHLIDKGF